MQKGFDKRGQVTIFIILAIIIVIGLVIVISIRPKSDVPSPNIKDPSSSIDSCIRKLVQDSADKIMKNGGEISPEKSIMYNGINYTYLCYNADYYQTCYNLNPMLELQIEEEIKKDTLENVENCFDTLEGDFKDNGFSISSKDLTYSIDLIPGSIKYNVQKELTVSKADSTQNFKDFSKSINSPLYDLVQVTRDVVNSEAEFCNFEYNGYMLLYPKYDIKRVDVDSSKIYQVIDRTTKQTFKFAVRSCALAPGI